MATGWSLEDIKREVREHILEEYLQGASPDELDDATPLISGGILDSISTIQLVSFLEGRFGVQFEAHEMDAEHLDTLPLIASTVTGKL